MSCLFTACASSNRPAMLAASARAALALPWLTRSGTAVQWSRWTAVPGHNGLAETAGMVSAASWKSRSGMAPAAMEPMRQASIMGGGPLK